MRILVVTNQDPKASMNKAFSDAIDHLKKQGHNLKVDFDLVKDNERKTPNFDEKYQGKVEKSIRETDIVIAEISNADMKIGFDIAKSLSEKKIVITLQNSKKNLNNISSIHGNTNRNLIVKEYNEKNLLNTVDTAIEEAKSKLDTKFILIISPEIDRYLDWAAGTKRMHKAQIVRNAVESTIKKDREYKNFLKG